MVGVIAGEGGIPVIPHGEGSAAFVIEEIQAADKCAGGLVRHKLPHNLAVLRHILVLLIACDFCGANAVHIVSVAACKGGQRRPRLHRKQLDCHGR